VLNWQLLTFIHRKDMSVVYDGHGFQPLLNLLTSIDFTDFTGTVEM